MNTVRFKLMGAPADGMTLIADGKRLKCRRNKFGSLEAELLTDKTEIDVEVHKYLEINGRFWFLMSVLFFIISCFNIFNPRYDRDCTYIKCRYTVKLKGDTAITLSFRRPKKTADGEVEKALEFKTDVEFEETENVMYYDARAKRRLRFMVFVKIALWIAAVALTVFLVAKLVVD